jgi:hypothetical protein
VRSIFGRASLAFPNLFLPGWQIEGLAIYEETAITGMGRLHAGDFRAIVDEAAREGRSTARPRQRRPDRLAGRTGMHAHGVGSRYLVDRSARNRRGARRRDGPPFALSRIARVRSLRQSLGTLWRDYETSLSRRDRFAAGREPHAADASGIHGHRPAVRSLWPRRLPARDRIPYNPGASGWVALDGLRPRRVTTRYLDRPRDRPGDLYFDQMEVRRNVGVQRPYAQSRGDGRVDGDEDARPDPDLSPDGGTLACTGSPGAA